MASRSSYSARALIVVFAIGMAGDLAAAVAGGYHTTAHAGQSNANILIFKTLGFIAIIALVVCACQHYQTPRKIRSSYRLPMWLMLAILVVFSLAVGQKQIIFAAIFAWVASRNYTHSRLRPGQALVIFLVALFVFTPIVQVSRTTEALQAFSGQSNLTRVQTGAEEIPRRIGQYISDFPVSALRGYRDINLRTQGSESLALAYLYTPSHRGYLHGAHWPEIFTARSPTISGRASQ